MARVGMVRLHLADGVSFSMSLIFLQKVTSVFFIILVKSGLFCG